MATLPETSSKLLDLIKDARSPRWVDFYNRYWPFLVCWAQQGGLSAVDAEEVAQQTLISVAQRMPNFVYDPKHKFRNYLYTALRNKLRDFWGQRKRRPIHVSFLEHDQPNPNDPFQQIWEDEFRRYCLQQVIDKASVHLDAEDLKIFYWYFGERQPAKKIAAQVGISSGQVANRAWKVKRKLEELARSHDPDNL